MGGRQGKANIREGPTFYSSVVGDQGVDGKANTGDTQGEWPVSSGLRRIAPEKLRKPALLGSRGVGVDGGGLDLGVAPVQRW
jgi:hypothetical protein